MTNIHFFRSTSEDFNPKAATPSHLCHSLIELLNQISPQFKRNFTLLQKKRSQRHPFERVATPYQLYAWTAPTLEHTLDAIRAEDSKFIVHYILLFLNRNVCLKLHIFDLIFFLFSGCYNFYHNYFFYIKKIVFPRYFLKMLFF